MQVQLEMGLLGILLPGPEFQTFFFLLSAWSVCDAAGVAIPSLANCAWALERETTALGQLADVGYYLSSRLRASCQKPAWPLHVLSCLHVQKRTREAMGPGRVPSA